MRPIDDEFDTPPDPGYYSFNLSGTYKVSAVTSTSITFTNFDGTAVAWDFIDTYFAGTTPLQSADFINQGEATSLSLAGVYAVDSVTAYEMFLTTPEEENTAWEELVDLDGGATNFQNGSVFLVTESDIGPFILDVPTLTKIYCNFVALNGLYRDDGTNQIPLTIGLQVDVTPVNSAGASIGPTVSYFPSLTGSGTDRNTVALTYEIVPAFTGRCSVKALRVTPKDTTSTGSVVDEVKWRDLYAVSPVEEEHFGDLTTVYSVTHATDGALAVKSRKLNMLVTRKLPALVDGAFTTDLYATNKAADILCAAALDPKIGNRTLDELDLPSIYGALAEVETYFGTVEAAEFNYTFDKFNVSFEETVTSIAEAVFCTAYRRGHTIKLSFEKETSDSVLLFNHRNKLPGSENRSIRFGNLSDNDGVIYQYSSPDDDALIQIELPSDGSAVNPKNVESIGVRSFLQAHFHANRIFNKMQYQNCTTEFTALQEAELLVTNDRILVADNTRPDTFDGEVVAQVVLQIELSQPFEPVGGLDHTIFLQHSNGTVEAIAVASVDGGNPYLIVLAGPPSQPLAIGDDLYRNATYEIVKNSSPRSSAFLFTERTPESNFTSSVTAINYDARYYDADKDFIDGVIDERAVPIE